MPDIRSRHVRATGQTFGAPKGECANGCGDWPCDAIREADRADKLLARCQELAEQVDELGAEVVEQSDRADKAEAERVAAQDIAIGAQEAEGRAEAALAEQKELTALAEYDVERISDARDKAEAALATAQDTAIAELQRLHTLKDKAEAALAEAMKTDPLDALKALDAARTDAKALADAGSHSVYCATPFALHASGDCTCGWSAALTSHREATDAV